ncbi:MAG: pyruvate kinase [Thermodesulfovibrionales bacterium]|nr:pyruvate kinase [Thermodesulfovibrionales bacterium]
MRKTKIIATIGPSSVSKDVIKALIIEGMDVARLNFSHGDHEFHRKVIKKIRALSKALKRPVAILQDLQGIKLRLGEIEGGSVELKKGSKLMLHPGTGKGNEKRLFISYKRLLEDLKPGHRVLIDDGLIELRIKKKTRDALIAEVIEGGIVKSKKGVNFPHSNLKERAFTEKDKIDLEFGLKEGIDIVALSFVRDAEDIAMLKKWLRKKRSDIPIIAKIEKPEAVRNIEEILNEVDGIMIARGDLGVELPPEEVPVIQKELLKKANLKARLTITATQMLESMTLHARPTRAEATDVANAIIDGSDCLMLSGETAVGRYPVEAVRMMKKIIIHTEASMEIEKTIPAYEYGFPEAIAHAACSVSKDINIKYIVAFTKTGFTARLLSKFRPPVPVIALTPYERVLRRMSIYHGVMPMLMRRLNSTDELINEVEKSLTKQGLLIKGDTIVITGSLPPTFIEGKTNFMKIHRIE